MFRATQFVKSFLLSTGHLFGFNFIKNNTGSCFSFANGISKNSEFVCVGESTQQIIPELFCISFRALPIPGSCALNLLLVDELGHSSL